MVSVRREFERISDPVRRAQHASWTNVLFDVLRVRDPAAVTSRAAALTPFHRDEDDRLILAEAEDVGCTVLITFDADFVKNLGPRARIPVMRPATYWEGLAIPHGAPVLNAPRFDNPLASQAWWRW